MFTHIVHLPHFFRKIKYIKLTFFKILSIAAHKLYLFHLFFNNCNLQCTCSHYQYLKNMGFEPALVSYKHTLNGLYGAFNQSATEEAVVREM